MKKFLTLLLAACLVLSLVACGEDKESTAAPASEEATVASKEETTAAAEEETTAAAEEADSSEEYIDDPYSEEPTQAPAPENDFTKQFNDIIALAKTLENDEYGMLTMLLAEDGYGATLVLVDADSYEMVLGMTEEDYAKYVSQAVEQKPNGSWFTHSLVLVEVKDGVDTAAVAKQILDGTSPSRFGCLKPSNISVAYSGNTILLAVSDESCVNAACAAFEQIVGSSTRLDRTNDWTGEGGGFFGGM